MSRGRHREATHERLAPMVTIAAVTVAGLLGSVSTAQAASDVDWDAIAQCESGGNWHINTHNNFYGGLQFTMSTWRGYGGSGNPASASREQQISVAERILQGQGIGAWPVCGHRAHTGNTRHITSAADTAPIPAPSTPPIAHTLAAPASPVAATPVPNIVMGPFLMPVLARPVQSSYMVSSGDTLSSIADEQHVPGGWPTLATANRGIVSDPDMITPDEVLTIPQ